MNDPLERATSNAPPVVGEGCTQRYDPQALTPENGATFDDAADLWRQLQDEQAQSSSTKSTGRRKPEMKSRI